jgi:hypothetical protein
MATLGFRKFTDPELLSKIDPALLVAFLKPWRSYLANRGLILPDDDPPTLNCEILANILLAPDGAAPKELIDALYYVHETSSPEDMDALLDLATERKLDLAPSPTATPTDVAIQLWLLNPNLVRERHAENIAVRVKTYAYYGGAHADAEAKFPSVKDEQRKALETALDDWFAEHNRGRGCKVAFFDHGKKVWILVRHGRPFTREASVKDDGQSSVEVYRPQINDILIYDVAADELAIHAATKGERELYLKSIGRFVFDDPAHFPANDKFTLEPLLTDGAAALLCEDVEGLEQILLVEYQRPWGGRFKEVETRKASDIFGALVARHGKLTAKKLSSATFKLKFSESKKRRTVAIRPPGYARYERNEDSELIEMWLGKRRFIREKAKTDDGKSSPALDGSRPDPAGDDRHA